MKKAVVLLSGGLDSATTLFLAGERGYKCYPLIFDYGQRHRREIGFARRIAQEAGLECRVIEIPLPWRGSALLDRKKRIPPPPGKKRIPATYVPARNTIFLSFALSYAEAIGARKIFIGANAVDYSGYPDCRPGYIKAFNNVITKGTKAGIEGKRISVEAPLINRTKAQIVRTGVKLGVPYEYTWSCYRGTLRPCGRCDSCLIRERGFREAGMKDPLRLAWKRRA
jgi:7-cyano-7-deazaguanine synthase